MVDVVFCEISCEKNDFYVNLVADLESRQMLNSILDFYSKSKPREDLVLGQIDYDQIALGLHGNICHRVRLTRNESGFAFKMINYCSFG